MRLVHKYDVRVRACYCAQVVEDCCNGNLIVVGLREGVTVGDMEDAARIKEEYEQLTGVEV